MPKTAPVIENLPADDTDINLALSGDVEVTCRLYGRAGENPDDCTTHEHEHTGTVLVWLDHLIYNENADSMIDALAHAVVDPDDLSDAWSVTWQVTGHRTGNVLALQVTVTP